MKILSDNKIIIEYGQVPGLGSPWIVKMYRKRFLHKQLISTDWFLDADQARRFAEQIAKQSGKDGVTLLLRERKPGWTLRRASH